MLAAEAQKERDDAEHQRLELQRQIADAQQTAALANERAEQDRLARLRIEERLASRRISETEFPVFVAALKPYAGASVRLDKIGDFEAGQFADDILKLLTEAKWNVQLQISGMISPPVYGLRCVVDESAAGRALGAILKKLPTAKVEVRAVGDTNARIIVGLKSPP